MTARLSFALACCFATLAVAEDGGDAPTLPAVSPDAAPPSVAVPDASELAPVAPAVSEVPPSGPGTPVVEPPPAGEPVRVEQAPPASPPSSTTTLPASAPSAVPDPDVPLRSDKPLVLRVLGRRRDDPRIVGSAQAIGESELRLFAHDDAQKVLKTVPGVYVREEDGFGLRPNIGLRGASSDRSSKVTLMEDGVLFGPAPYAAPAAYYFPMMARASSVEVFKGPASVRSGPQTIGGALDMVTRAVPDRLVATMDVAAGMYGTARAHGVVGTGDERFGVLLEGVRLQTDGFKQLDGGGPTGFTKDEAMLKAHARFGGEVKNAFELKLGWSDEDSHETYLGLDEQAFRATPLRRFAASQLDRMRWWRTQLQVAHRLVAGEAFELHTVAYRHDMHRRWDRLDGFRGGRSLGGVLSDPSGANGVFLAVLEGREDNEDASQQLLLAGNDRTFVSQGVQSTGTWRFATGPARHGLHFGARLHADSIRRAHDATFFDMRSGRMLAAGGEPEMTALNTGAVEALALHALDELEAGDFTLAPGARFELIRTTFVDDLAGTRRESLSPVLLPGFGAAWQPLKPLAFLAGVHRGFSPVAPGSPEGTNPEESVNVELGGRYRTRRHRAELIGFYNRYSNIVGNCTGSAGCTDAASGAQYNGGAADVGGLEASGGLREKAWDLTLTADASYTLTATRFATTFTSAFPQFGSVREGDELPYVPLHQAALSLGVECDRFRFGLTGTFVGAMRDRAGQGEARPGELTDHQLVLDAAGQLRLAPGAWLTLKATNLTNAAYVVSRRPFGARPNQPLTAMVGFRWELDGE